MRGWMAFQAALLKGLDRRFTFFFWFNQLPGVAQLRLEGAFLGQPAEALELLEGAGMLQGLDRETRYTAEQSDVVGRYAAGVRLQEVPDFYSLYKEVRAGTVGAVLKTGLGGRWQGPRLVTRLAVGPLASACAHACACHVSPSPPPPRRVRCSGAPLCSG